MCYSAIIEAEWDRYVRETGCEMDLEQFEEIFGQRAKKPTLNIPRAVERWFEEPKTPAARRIRQMISQHRAAERKAIEEDQVKQTERLATAKQKLAVKVTKGASEHERIATKLIKQNERWLAELADPKPRPSDGRIFPMHYAPLIIEEGGKRLVRLARYHCRQADKLPAIDYQKKGLYNARRDNIDRWWRNEFMHTHGVMFVREFYESVERPDGTKFEIHFKPNPYELMRIACVYAVWTGQAGEKLLSYAAVTDEPPPEVEEAGHDRMMINLQARNVGIWLSPEGRSAQELQQALDDREKPYYEHKVSRAA
jgi:putative SOS response-associated peptidase YedK